MKGEHQEKWLPSGNCHWGRGSQSPSSPWQFPFKPPPLVFSINWRPLYSAAIYLEPLYREASPHGNSHFKPPPLVFFLLSSSKHPLLELPCGERVPVPFLPPWQFPEGSHFSWCSPVTLLPPWQFPF